MELCDDNLLDYFLREKERKHKLNPEEIHDIISQLNNSFRIMVKNKILHRALRPQNILMKYLNEEKSKFIVKLKLTDDSGILNSSNNLISQDRINDDNLRFYAPEVLEKGIYTEKSDLFSLGILMYYLCFNEYPFEGKKNEILDKIKKGINKKADNPEFDDLLKNLLNGNENERISWEDYFKHEFFRTNQDFNKYYEIYNKDKKLCGQLGQSGHGIIYKAKDKKTGEMKAIKIVDMFAIRNHWMFHANEVRKPTNDDLKPYYKGFFNEINNMKILQGKNNQNQNTVIFYEYFNTKESFAYIMEKCDGNLLDYIMDKNLNIEEIKNMLIQLNNSFKIMHEKKILHRAIKPENILYKKDNNSKIIFKLKLTDICCLLKDSSKIEMSTIILYNNLCISAPEVLKGEKFKEESDLWSLGVLIYYLKFKKYPFNGKNKDEILSQIKKVKLEETNNKVFDDLVKKLLTVDSKKRMSWRTYFDHPFFK
jgi:serine/threonine protein kinase